MDNQVPTGLIELMFSDNEVSSGLYLSNETREKFTESLEKLMLYFQDNMDQNMARYCDYVTLLQLYELISIGTKNKNYFMVCDCSK